MRIIYFILAIYIDYLSTDLTIERMTIHKMTWGLTFLTLFPIPIFFTNKEDNILLKVFMYIFPFYILLTRSYEALFIIVFYNYLQIWIKLKFRDNPQKTYKFNYIDIFFYISISYASFFSTGNVASISGFTLSSVFRFFSINQPLQITALILTKILSPTLFMSSMLFEICEVYDYSTSDSLFMMISMCEVMNIKFFFDIRDNGSWLEIGMSIAYFIISNVISFMQFIIFLVARSIFWTDNKLSKCYLPKNEMEMNLTNNISITPKEIEMGIKNSNYKDIETIDDIDNEKDNDKDNINEKKIDNDNENDNETEDMLKNA